MEINIALSTYKGKKVLITGHTGFKGTWLGIWLNMLGAKVYGISLDPKNKFDLFNLSSSSELYEKDIRIDIRDKERIFETFNTIEPEFVFHIAAQALVLDSYESPLETFEINTQGTANILEAIRLTRSVKVGVFITTDKVYENKEWIYPYREDEKLGGYDPYSASKGAAEILISSYRNSFFNNRDYNSHQKSIASVRAGNVIGGGDWAENRIIPDCIRAIEKDHSIKVRNPNAIRPWQHVLEPLGGYLLLGSRMKVEPLKYNEAWNFGPESKNIVDVGNLVEGLIAKMGKGSWEDKSDNNNRHEAQLLSLDINKAKYRLDWQPILNFSQTLELTAEWYLKYRDQDVMDLCRDQLSNYITFCNSYEG